MPVVLIPGVVSADAVVMRMLRMQLMDRVTQVRLTGTDLPPRASGFRR